MYLLRQIRWRGSDLKLRWLNYLVNIVAQMQCAQIPFLYRSHTKPYDFQRVAPTASFVGMYLCLASVRKRAQNYICRMKKI